MNDDKNICKFVSTKNNASSVNIMNFVYEKAVNGEFNNIAAYSVALVTAGKGTLVTGLNSFPLNKGDVFFTFPSQPYRIVQGDGLKYVYIGFLGSRITSLYGRLGIQRSAPVYHGNDSLIPLFENSVSDATTDNIDMLCEGLLLLTLSRFCKSSEELPRTDVQPSGVLAVKQFVDTHCTERDVTLKNMAKKFGYNEKYLSVAFKATTRIGFTQYVRGLRLRYAQTLIEHGVSYIREIAEQSGFGDVQSFSKAYKQKYGVSPKQATAVNRQRI